MRLSNRSRARVTPANDEAGEGDHDVRKLCAVAFKVGQSFFEPPGSTHVVSANARSTQTAELIAMFVADEGAQLTTDG